MQKQEKGNVLETVKVSKIVDAIFEFRNPELASADRATSEYQEFKQSIAKAGLLLPITLAPHEQKEGRYVLIDGRRRLDAVIELGHKEIESVILVGRSELDLIIVAIDQNLHRLNLNETEKIEVVIKALKAAGYGTGMDDLVGLKNKAARIHKELQAGNKPKGEDEKFVYLVERLGLSVSYVYNMLRWKTDLQGDLFERVIKVRLPTDIRNILVKSPLNEERNAKVQLNAFNEVESMIASKASREKIKAVIDAYVRDAKLRKEQEKETGQTMRWKSEEIEEEKPYRSANWGGSSYLVEGTEIDPEEQPNLAQTRKLVDQPPQVEVTKEKDPLTLYTELNIAVANFLSAATGYKEAKGVTNYRDETIIGTEDFRRELVEHRIPQDLYPLRGRLLVMRDVINSLLDQINKRLAEKTNEDLR